MSHWVRDTEPGAPPETNQYPYTSDDEDWWRQQDDELRQQEDERLRADIDRKNLHEQPQPEKQP